ncbi:hypothetical protein [Acinetobacter guillouiae]|uniref:hypothetical protein n=1 Tax=Acinetobacter guillouiae TaxID=106649 RepID=UPI00300A8605
MKTDNLIQNIVAFAILVTLFLIGFTWIIFDFSKSPSSLKDSLSIVSSLFGGVATLTAAYIASRLFNDWRKEKDHDTKSIYLNNAINNLFEIESNLLNCKKNIKELKNINENLIIISKFNDDFSKSHENTLILLNMNLKVIESVFNTTQFSKDLSVYEKYIKQFNEFSILLSKRYKTYYYYYIDTYYKLKPSNDININRPFFPQRKLDLDATHAMNASLVLDILNTHRVITINEKEECIYFSDYIERCLKEHRNLFNLCTKALKANN